MGGSDWVTGGGLFAGMPTMTGKQIHENFQSGTGSASLHSASQEVQKLGEDYGELQSAIEDLMTRMKPHWKGKAGALARHGAGPIAVEFAAAKPKLNTTQDLVRRQGELFDRTKANVVPVPDKPEAPSGWGSMLAEGASVVFLGHDTGEVHDYENQLSAHNDAAQHNVNQMHKYSSGSDYNTTNLPDSYGKMLGSEGEIHIDHSGGGDSAGGTGNAPGSTTGNYHGYTPGGHDNGGTQPGSSVPGTGGGLHAPPRPGGDPADATSTTETSAAPGTTAPGYGPGQQPGGGWSQSPGGRVPGGSGGGLHGNSPGGFYPGSGGLGGNGSGSESGSGYGRSGTRGPGGAGEEPRPGSRSGLGRDGHPTTGGTSAAQEAAGRTGPGRGGRMMPGSGRKGGGNDDYEHQTPDFLIEPEPDKFWFGDQPKIAPPCIGE